MARSYPSLKRARIIFAASQERLASTSILPNVLAFIWTMGSIIIGFNRYCTWISIFPSCWPTSDYILEWEKTRDTIIRMKKLSLLLIGIMLMASSSIRKDPYLIFPTGHEVIYDICFSQNGSTLIVADGREIKWFSSKDGHLLSTLSGGHRNAILALDLSADSSLLASEEGTVWFLFGMFPKRKLSSD